MYRLTPIAQTTLQAVALSASSNIFAQIITAYRNDQSVTFSGFIQLLRFVVQTAITTPPNYKWQQFLERNFPSYHDPDLGSSLSSGRHNRKNSIPMTNLDIKSKAPSYDRDEKSKPRSQVDTTAPTTTTTTTSRKLNIRNLFLKWVIDSLTIGIFVNTSVFLFLMGVLKGHDLAHIVQTVQRETLPLVLAGFHIWPIFSIVSFAFIPVERRVVFASSLGFFWGIYMSFVAARV